MTFETFYRLREEEVGGERFNFIDAEIRLPVVGTRHVDRPVAHDDLGTEHMYTAGDLTERLGATDLLTAWEEDDHEVHRHYLVAVHAQLDARAILERVTPPDFLLDA